jgi:hypothetical protein
VTIFFATHYLALKKEKKIFAARHAALKKVTIILLLVTGPKQK